MKQSICKWCYDGKLSLDELCKAAVKLGYKSIELVSAEDWPAVFKHGLTCAMVPGTGPIVDCLNRRQNHERCEAELRKNLRLAADAGLPNVICFSGNRGGLPDGEGIDHCAAALKRVAGLAEELKVNICMEILNSKVDHQDYQFDHMAFGLEVVKRVGSPRVGILYDIYHAQIMEGDVIRTIRENHPHIFHYHTGGNPGRHEIDDTQELNYRAIVKAILDTGYTGYLGQEFIPQRDPEKSLAQAFEICNV